MTHSCDKCGKEFRHRQSLHRHKKETHTPAKFGCAFCKIDYKRKEYLFRHIWKHHQKTPETPAPVTTPEVPEPAPLPEPSQEPQDLPDWLEELLV